MNWTADFTNDPHRNFELCLTLNDDEDRGVAQLGRSDSGEVVLTVGGPAWSFLWNGLKSWRTSWLVTPRICLGRSGEATWLFGPQRGRPIPAAIAKFLSAIPGGALLRTSGSLTLVEPSSPCFRL